MANYLCCYLEVPGKESAGRHGNTNLTHKEAKEEIHKKIDEGYKVVLPLPVLLETGNLITNSKVGNEELAKKNRESAAKKLSELANDLQKENSRWFSFTNLFVEKDIEVLITKSWHGTGKFNYLTLTDVSMLVLRDLLMNLKNGDKIEILTTDTGLKNAFEKMTPSQSGKGRTNRGERK
jgi:hypothetical protein